ncbi:hypothetical protein NQ117_03980 [Paenibacillus sp. SC116]|uniref:hypothetical protein n=1 Tax=Paenibacillus sp. SC116 TaxID=2968986 RepID=UPI00215ADE94|nr:hypothetical protein [Paenibacillus sp. SC116]MCR8842832.1 hypothetical protein [Paenibacillus sp. SC116]
MDVLSYLLMGAVDVLAVLVLSFKMYRLPLFKHKYKVAAFVLIAALFSYLMRIVLEFPQYDLPGQYLLIVLFLIGFMDIRLHHAAFVAAGGTTAFILIQMIMYYIFLYSGILDSSVLTSTEGLFVFLLQASTQVITLSIACFLYLFKYGYTFIPVTNTFEEPGPLDMPMVLATLLSCVTISLSILLLYASTPMALVALAAASFGCSYFLSKRRSYDEIRVSVEAHRNRNKAK